MPNSPARPLRLRSPAETLAAIPYLLGFHPESSLVVLALRGARSRVFMTVRVDLPAAADRAAVESVAGYLAEVVARHGPDGVLLAGYGSGERVTPLTTRLLTTLPASGIPVRESLRVDGGRYWSYLCRDPGCCPPEGRAFQIATSAVAAEATFSGRAALPSRRALASTIEPVTGADYAAMQRAVARVRRRYARTFGAAGCHAPLVEARRRVADALRRLSSPGASLGDDEAAWLGVLVAERSVRDDLWLRLDGGEAHLRLWSHLTRRLPARYLPAPACLLAFTAWLGGDGGLANLALDRAAAADPGYPVLRLMRELLTAAVPPQRWLDVRSRVRRSAQPGVPPTLECMPEFIYQMRNVRKSHGDKLILENVTLAFLPGAKIGVVGPNGTGKSTLLRMMAGRVQPSNGDARLMPGYSVGILEQEPALNEAKTVLGNVEEGVAQTKALLERYNEVAEKMATDYSDELLEEMGKLQEQLDHRDAWDLDSQLEQAMDALRCPPADAEVTQLSGGERRRVALCRLLLSQPDLLLLDEPTNHLDAESVQWLEQHLEEYRGTVVAVTHDRYFLDNVAGWILELDRGSAYPYEGNYSTYLETKAARLQVEGQKDAKHKKRLEEELEWVRSNARARQAKSRARLERYEEMAAEAAKQRKLDFEEIQIPPGPRLGSTVVEVEHVTKGFDDRVLMEDLTFSLPQGGIVGVIGPNGVGKTTLFKMIVGEEQPDAGRIRVGDTVRIAYVDQARERIAADQNVWQVISDGEAFIRVGNVEIPSRAYVAAFGFKGGDQQRSAGVLSGGERNRVNLALTLKQGGNLLLLDEPTNDLDVETLSSLENALQRFPGCAVITSHDRYFLDRVATHILAWEGDANWFWFEGNFEAYEKNKVERLGAEAARPHRVTYRRLTRG